MAPPSILGLADLGLIHFELRCCLLLAVACIFPHGSCSGGELVYGQYQAFLQRRDHGVVQLLWEN